MNAILAPFSNAPTGASERFSIELLPACLKGRGICATLDGDALSVVAGERALVRLRCERRSEACWTADVSALDVPDENELMVSILAALHAAFASAPGLRRLSIRFDQHRAQAQTLLRAGVGIAGAAAESSGAMPLDFFRAMFWQHPLLWLTGACAADYPLHYVISPEGRRHPLRPPRPEGIVYRRFIPQLGGWLSLRTADAEKDLAVFHDWMNNPRVNHFWEESGSVEQHRAYLAGVLAKPHTHPLIGCFDDQPFGYFEAYWAKEDRIAPFYRPDDYDRGLHMLIGNESFRGPARVAAWLPSLAHYLFLDDPRTRAVVAEPRADNEKMIGYLQRYGFARIKHFDFPHKRAALMMLQREAFFEEGIL